MGVKMILEKDEVDVVLKALYEYSEKSDWANKIAKSIEEIILDGMSIKLDEIDPNMPVIKIEHI